MLVIETAELSDGCLLRRWLWRGRLSLRLRLRRIRRLGRSCRRFVGGLWLVVCTGNDGLRLLSQSFFKLPMKALLLMQHECIISCDKRQRFNNIEQREKRSRSVLNRQKKKKTSMLVLTGDWKCLHRLSASRNGFSCNN